MSPKTANSPLRPLFSVILFARCDQDSLHYYFIITFIIFFYKINTALKALILTIASFGFPFISFYLDRN